jgi:hypothetical protein
LLDGPYFIRVVCLTQADGPKYRDRKLEIVVWLDAIGKRNVTNATQTSA